MKNRRIGQFIILSLIAPAIVLGAAILVETFVPTLPMWQVLAGLLFVWGVFVWWSVAVKRDPLFISKRELDLMASQEKFVTLYQHSPVPYVTIKPSGEIQTANLAAVRLFSLSVDSIGGQPLFPMLAITDPNQSGIVRGKVMVRTPVVDIEAEVTTGDQSRWVLFSMYPFSGGREILVALVDITEQKIIDTAKSEFLALATHQLRTPVAATRWNVELLRRSLKEVLNEKADDYLVKIERNVLRMIALINDFLSVSKLETGTFAAETETISLSEQFDTICDEFTQTVTKKNLTLTREYEPPEAEFTTDTRLFHIIVSNLISNAVKYVAAAATVTVRYELSAQTLIITIADTGIGIPEAEIEQLFTKFYRASNAQAHKAEGTGLGLYIVQQSVEKLGGTISVSSVLEEGTTFTVTLPTNYG